VSQAAQDLKLRLPGNHEVKGCCYSSKRLKQGLNSEVIAHLELIPNSLSHHSRQAI